MSTRKQTRTATTRRLISELDDSYEVLVSAAFLYAEIADNDEERTLDRLKATIEWESACERISARVAEEGMKELSWASQRPRAV